MGVNRVKYTVFWDGESELIATISSRAYGVSQVPVQPAIMSSLLVGIKNDPRLPKMMKKPWVASAEVWDRGKRGMIDGRSILPLTKKELATMLSAVRRFR